MSQRNIWKGLITLFFLIILLCPQTTVEGETNEPELIIESEFKFLYGDGGGHITVTVQGDLAQYIREDIFKDYLKTTNNDEIITEDIVDQYSEAIEDLLEMDINSYNIQGDQGPENAFVDYDGYYKIMKFDSKVNRVDVRSITGLIGTINGSRSKFTIKIDVKETHVENRELILTDGYLILYALWGEEIPSFHVYVKEVCNIITIGMDSYSNFKAVNGGEITHYRLILGEYLEYRHNYELNGYVLSNGKKDTIRFESFNVFENAVVLFIFILIFSIISSIISHFITKKNRIKKVTILRVLAIIFFFILLIIYCIGIYGYVVLGLTIAFFIINLILINGVYIRGWGNLAKVVFKREDFLKEPPKIEQGPWHERGIANAKVGNFSEAVNCFEMALETEPENATIWNDLGFVLRKSGNYRTAVDSFDKALEIRPDYETAMVNLEKTKQEMLAKQKKRIRKQ